MSRIRDAPKVVSGLRTLQVLMLCKQAGYHMLTIGKPDKTNPGCRGWLSGPYSLWAWHESFGDKYLSAPHSDDCRISGWPAIWYIATRVGCHQRYI